jgi:pimeloyl-ACP methyl ester carboxylesterase/membrane protein DedA with SNARE-associated domain
MDPAPERARGAPRWPRSPLVAWGLLLLFSHGVRLARGREVTPRADESALWLRAVAGAELGAPRVRTVYADSASWHAPDPDALPLVLLHGSPGSRRDVARLAQAFPPARRTIAPDLPGFGRSTRALSDYSIRAQACYVLQLLDALGLERVHVLGFSWGGGVALELTALAPGRVASLSLVSSLGVQELELLGDHGLNHALHGLQLGLFWCLFELVPHFGLLDRGFLSLEYARSFYDSDQRPLRAILQGWDGPLRIVHGERDPLVPVAAAREHQRLAPQAELALHAGDHFLVFRQPALLAGECEEFLRRVERGQARVRAGVGPEELACADRPWDPAQAPPLAGLALWLVLLLAGLATLVSEDLTCVAVGGLVAAGRVPFLPGVLACFFGILLGDVLLFMTGRWFGGRALVRPPCSWFLSAERVARAAAWLERRGPVVILVSRFLPGARLPTYFASGALGTDPWRFTLWFALAGLLWTPALVGLAAALGRAALERLLVLREQRLLALLVTVVLAYVLLALGRTLSTRRGRALLRARLLRARRFEYWPPALFYLPIVLVCLREGWRRRSLLAFSAANPAIPHGGFVGESKALLYRRLEEGGAPLPATLVLGAGLPAPERLRAARDFAARHGFPLVLKPDAGQRGEGVRIVRTPERLEVELGAAREALVLQAFVPGPEFGLLYARRPDEPRGRLLSITAKELPVVIGDGRRRLEELVLDDDATLPLARFFLEHNAARLDRVPAPGERIEIGELGTHCRGARFLDGRELATPELGAELERCARALPGFFLGRFDVRAPSRAELARGRFTIIELNGVTSEPGHVYDPRGSLRAAWAAFAAHWRLAYEIGAANIAQGARASSLRELLAAWWGYRRLARERAACALELRTRSAPALGAAGGLLEVR